MTITGNPGTWTRVYHYNFYIYRFNALFYIINVELKVYILFPKNFLLLNFKKKDLYNKLLHFEQNFYVTPYHFSELNSSFFYFCWISLFILIL